MVDTPMQVLSQALELMSSKMSQSFIRSSSQRQWQIASSCCPI